MHLIGTFVFQLINQLITISQFLWIWLIVDNSKGTRMRSRRSVRPTRSWSRRTRGNPVSLAQGSVGSRDAEFDNLLHWSMTTFSEKFQEKNDKYMFLLIFMLFCNVFEDVSNDAKIIQNLKSDKYKLHKIWYKSGR